MSLPLTEDQIARQPPEAQVIIRALLAKLAAMEAELQELQRQLKGSTPQNSSLPRNTQHPHDKPAPRKHGGISRHVAEPTVLPSVGREDAGAGDGRRAWGL